MKEPTDALGNKLYQGCLVGVKVGDQFLVGKISFLSSGGISLATGGNPKPQQTPGQLVIDVQVPMYFAPESRIGALYCLIDPSARSLVDEVAKQESIKQAIENASKPFTVPGPKE